MSSYFPDQSSQQLSFQGATREQPSARETETKVWTYLPWWFQHCCFAPIFNCVVLRSLLFFFFSGFSNWCVHGFHSCLIYYVRQMFNH